jgi:glutamyl-Q tRNA(Asp) synthetase
LRYRGRFAPTPTGPLHFGSLVAAVGSYLCARKAGGDWLVRIEDLDPPREVPGSADQIIAALAALGFQWNESILRQSERRDAYQDATERLLGSALAFACSCSRTELQAAQDVDRADGEELHYPGWCRNGVRNPARELAIRFRIEPGEISFDDILQGHQSFDLARDVGDFVIRRRDGLHAYQLAVVVDDAAQGITHVVRGVDLLNSTPRQIALQGALGLPRPLYAHLPVATDANGIKLSKSAGAAAIDTHRATHELWRALRFLRQSPPRELLKSRVETLWEWAIDHWRVQPLRHLRQAPVADPL